MRLVRSTLRVRSPGTNLRDYGQILGRIDTEHFHAHTISIMVTLPNVREPSGSECNVAAFRDVVQERVRAWKDDMFGTDSPQDAGALSPEVKVHVRSVKSLCGGSKGAQIIFRLLT